MRRLLKSGGHLVLRAHLRELSSFASIPDEERDEFDPARILNVEIGAAAYDSLSALIDAGHELRWHRWERDDDCDTVGAFRSAMRVTGNASNGVTGITASTEVCGQFSPHRAENLTPPSRLDVRSAANRVTTAEHAQGGVVIEHAKVALHD